MLDLGDVISTLAEQRRYLSVTRDAQVLEAQLETLNELRLAVESTKEAFIEVQDEEKANLWLAAEDLCSGVVRSIQMFCELKKNNPDSAWNQLVEAQNFALWSCDKDHLLNHMPSDLAADLGILERALFPPQQFGSPCIVAKTKCGICGSPMHECNHIRGDAYMGRHCTEVVTEFAANHEAVVDKPGDKRCRDTHHGTSRDKTANVTALLDETAGRNDGT